MKDKLTHQPRTETSVQISGLDTSTPDDLVQDGKCAQLHNLRYSGNAWRPVHPHAPIREVDSGIVAPIPVGGIVYYHPTLGEGKYITEQAQLLPKQFTYAVYDYEQNTSTTIATFSEKQRITHFGNILIFSCASAVVYYLYSNGSYHRYVHPSAPTISDDSDNLQYAGYAPDVIIPQQNIYNYYATDNVIFSIAYEQGKCYPRTYLMPMLSQIKRTSDYVDSVDPPGIPEDYAQSPDIGLVWKITDITNNESSVFTTPPHNDRTPATEEMWHGEIAVFSAYRLKDGSVVSPSPLHIISSNNETYHRALALQGKVFENAAESVMDDTRFLVARVDVNSDYGNASIPMLDYSPIGYHLPTIKVNIDSAEISTELIHSVVVFSTRINSIYTPTKKILEDGQHPFTELYDTNILADQPFYLLKEIPIEVKNGAVTTEYSIKISRTLLDEALHNIVYTPSIPHTAWGNTSLEYNNMLHLAGVRTILSTEGIDHPFVSGTAGAFRAAVTLNINGNDAYAVGSITNAKGEFSTPYNRIISYHDYRGRSLLIEKDGAVISTFPLTEATGNNIAYFVSPPEVTTKYPEIFPAHSGNEPNGETIPPDATNSVLQENRIQVSATNNPLVYPFSQSYSIGSMANRVLAIQSAALEMHEMKIGEMPLYVFSEEGVFALIAGSETLYASVAAINYDKIINPCVIAVNRNVAYITERGVHLLNSQGSQVISTPIHNEANEPPLNFLRTATMFWAKEYNELIVSNGDETISMGIAFVFNLDSAMWSTRALNGRIINADRLYHNRGIYNLSNEDESISLPASLTTRPIKLGNVEFKRVESVIPRFSTGLGSVVANLQLQGSVDGTIYLPLRSIDDDPEYEANRINPIVIRRTPFSAKYFTFALSLSSVTADEPFTPSITHIDFAWYTRFRHRMR